jgi:hypothetical protein
MSSLSSPAGCLPHSEERTCDLQPILGIVKIRSERSQEMTQSKKFGYNESEEEKSGAPK